MVSLRWQQILKRQLTNRVTSHIFTRATDVAYATDRVDHSDRKNFWARNESLAMSEMGSTSTDPPMH